MSGGHFDYEQFRIRDIKDEVDRVIKNNGNPGIIQDEEVVDFGLEDLTIAQMKYISKLLDMAFKSTHKLDYLLSGDTGEKQFQEWFAEYINSDTLKKGV